MYCVFLDAQEIYCFFFLNQEILLEYTIHYYLLIY